MIRHCNSKIQWRWEIWVPNHMVRNCKWIDLQHKFRWQSYPTAV